MRAINRALDSGGRHCFFVISNARELTAADRERLARRDGNEHVESAQRYDVMMEQAGFVDVDLADVTAQYAETLLDWKREWEEGAEALIDLVGEEDFGRRLANRDIDIANVADGLLARYKVYGVKP